MPHESRCPKLICCRFMSLDDEFGIYVSHLHTYYIYIYINLNKIVKKKKKKVFEALISNVEEILC